MPAVSPAAIKGRMVCARRDRRRLNVPNVVRTGQAMRSPKMSHESLPLKDGTLRLVVVSDTHASPHYRAMELVAREKPDTILHAGDVGSLSVIDELRRIAPVLAVRGNIDAPSAELPDSRTIALLDGTRTVLTLLLVHYGVNGPRIAADAARLARSEKAGLVVCGHSHVPFLGQDKGLVVFNPGSIGPRRFKLPIVFGVIELAQGGISMKHVDCETGQTWKP